MRTIHSTRRTSRSMQAAFVLASWSYVGIAAPDPDRVILRRASVSEGHRAELAEGTRSRLSHGARTALDTDSW